MYFTYTTAISLQIIINNLINIKKGKQMKRMINRKWIAVLAVFSLVFIIGCGKAEEKKKKQKAATWP